MKIYQKLALGCAHLSLVGGLMLLTFYITDRYNSAMAFIDHPMTKTLVAILSVLVLAVSAWLIVSGRWQKRGVLRYIVSIISGLSAVASFSLLVLDHSMTRRFEQGLSKEPPLLFQSPDVKLVLAALAVLAAVAGIWLIATDRKYGKAEESVC